MTTHTAPDWLTVGGSAVVLQPETRSSLRAKLVTVEKITKVDVVVTGGDRFRFSNDLTQRGSTWSVTTYLVPEHDPRVAETRRKIKHANLRHRAIVATEAYRKGQAPAREVAAAWTALAHFEEPQP